MKRLCVFYYKAYEWFGRDCIEWIVCKECQKRLTREGAVRPFFQRSPSAKRDTRQAPYPRGWRPGRGDGENGARHQY